MSAAVINPRKDLARVAAQMHRALQSKPCACGKRVNDGGKLVQVSAGGCAAIEAYEAVAEVSACS